MQSMEECLLMYRRALRQLMADCGIASNPGVDDEWILEQVQKLIPKSKVAIKAQPKKTRTFSTVRQEIKRVKTKMRKLGDAEWELVRELREMCRHPKKDITCGICHKCGKTISYCPTRIGNHI